MHITYSLRRAEPADLPAAAKVLASAFASYSWTRWSIPADDYESRLEQLQSVYLAHACEHGLVFIDDHVRAVAAFLPPDAPPLADDLEERVVALHGDRLLALAELDLPGPPAGAWTLATVGVDPSHQGSGLGTAVTSVGLEQIDRKRAPIALETSDDRNVRLYERLGFTLDATTFIPGGPPVYSMSRPPQPESHSVGESTDNMSR